jgi:hypothetical protein
MVARNIALSRPELPHDGEGPLMPFIPIADRTCDDDPVNRTTDHFSHGRSLRSGNSLDRLGLLFAQLYLCSNHNASSDNSFAHMITHRMTDVNPSAAPCFSTLRSSTAFECDSFVLLIP